MSETEDNRRKTRFNPRTLFLAAIKNTELGHPYTARNESNYSGSSLTARGVAHVIKLPDYVAQDGGKTTAILFHKTLQNVGAGSETSLSNSMTFLLDADTGAFKGFSVYASNYPYRPIPAVPLQYYDTNDWQIATTPGVLALPNTNMYADFTTTSTVWTSALSPMTPANKVATADPKTFNPRAWGATKTVGGMSFGMTQTVFTVPKTDLVCYRFDATVWVYGVTHQDQMDVYVSLNQRKIVRTVTANDYVIVDTTPPYQFRPESIRLTRLEDPKTTAQRS